MKIKQLDHVAVHVTDLTASISFYQNVLQLEPLPRPNFDFAGAWFRLGTTQELHLIAGRSEDVNSARRGNHFALQVDDADVWEKHVKANHVEYIHKLRPDGAQQIFFQDPDGYWIELCCLTNA